MGVSRPAGAFRAWLAEPPPVILDGGLATELEESGHRLDDHLWSARLLRDSPAAIAKAHADYVASGAQMVISASYQASWRGFERAGIGREEAERLMRLSVELARRGCDAGRPAGAAPALVAASVGCYGATMSDGAEYTGVYDVDEAGLEAFHTERLGAGRGRRCIPAAADARSRAAVSTDDAYLPNLTCQPPANTTGTLACSALPLRFYNPAALAQCSPVWQQLDDRHAAALRATGGDGGRGGRRMRLAAELHVLRRRRQQQLALTMHASVSRRVEQVIKIMGRLEQLINAQAQSGGDGRWVCPVGSCAVDGTPTLLPLSHAHETAPGDGAAPPVCFTRHDAETVVAAELDRERALLTEGRYQLAFPCADCSSLLRFHTQPSRDTWLSVWWLASGLDRLEGDAEVQAETGAGLVGGGWVRWAAEYGVCDLPSDAFLRGKGE